MDISAALALSTLDRSPPNRRRPGLLMAVACLASAVAFTVDAAQQAPKLTTLVVPHPVVLEANSVVIDPNSLSAEGITVVVNYPGIARGQTVGLRWASTQQTWNSEIVTVDESLSVSIKVPANVVNLDANGHATLTSSVKEEDDRPIVISAPLAISVAALNGPGTQTAAALNSRFLDTRDACDNDTPAYYCNGITLRSTDNGDFDPWDPSPKAVELGSVSFSWLRRGTHVTTTHTSSGFIFLPQKQAIEQNKETEYLCVYAYDAWTALPERPDHGCGIQPQAELSSCASKNATTVEGWQTYSRALTSPPGTTPTRFQCSLSTQDAEQFAVSYKVRANRPPKFPDVYNEILIKTWAQGTPQTLPLEAFYYTNSAGLRDAKVYQQKYKERTGNWLPMVKLDLTRLSTSTPVSYNPADQAVQP